MVFGGGGEGGGDVSPIKERCVVGREERRLSLDDLPDRRIFLKLFIEECSHRTPVPPFRMDKIRVERKVAFIKAFQLKPRCFGAVHRQVEDGGIHKGDVFAVLSDEGQRPLRLLFCLIRCAEKKVDICCYASLF